MSKIVSFSLWGDRPIYLVGALHNAALCPQIYPGWIARFYVGTTVPAEFRGRLVELGAEVIPVPEPGDRRGMLWRFAAAADPEVEVMLSRDCDSRPTPREAAAVAQWMASPAQFHIMRDHPFHDAPIMGGMWGAKYPLLHDIDALMRDYPAGDYWQVDQHFLRDIVFPRVRDVAMVHDEFFEGRPFPRRRRGLQFVGQPIDENGRCSRVSQWVLAKGILLRKAKRAGQRLGWGGTAEPKPPGIAG